MYSRGAQRTHVCMEIQPDMTRPTFFQSEALGSATSSSGLLPKVSTVSPLARHLLDGSLSQVGLRPGPSLVCQQKPTYDMYMFLVFSPLLHCVMYSLMLHVDVDRSGPMPMFVTTRRIQ
jgi:hypothetical protein